MKWEINLYMRGSCKIFSESETYRTVQSCKPHFFQNCPLVQLYAAANDCKGFGNIALVKAFIAPSHSYCVSSITKASLSAEFIGENR